MQNSDLAVVAKVESLDSESISRGAGFGGWNEQFAVEKATNARSMAFDF